MSERDSAGDVVNPEEHGDALKISLSSSILKSFPGLAVPALVVAAARLLAAPPSKSLSSSSPASFLRATVGGFLPVPAVFLRLLDAPSAFVPGGARFLEPVLRLVGTLNSPSSSPSSSASSDSSSSESPSWSSSSEPAVARFLLFEAARRE